MKQLKLSRVSLKSILLFFFPTAVFLWNSFLFIFFHLILCSSSVGHNQNINIFQHMFIHKAHIYLFFTLASVALVIFITLFIFRIIILPLEKLAAVIRQARQGNLDIKADMPMQSEFVPLVEAFNEMTANLKNITVSRDELNKEIAARKIEQEFSKVILESVEPLVVIDTEYKIITANKSYCQQVKMPLSEITGQYCYKISHHINQPCYMSGEECATKHTLQTGQPQTVIHKHYNKDEGVIYVEVKTYPIKDVSGKVVSVIETVNDVTSRKKVEMELERKVVELEKFRRLAVDRELRMIELKKKIKELS